MGLIRIVGFDAGFAMALTGGWIILKLRLEGAAIGLLTFTMGLVLMAAALR